MEQLDAAQSPETGKKKIFPVWLIVGAGILIVGLIAAALLLRNSASQEYLAGLVSYQKLLPKPAEAAFTKVAKYPGILGSFVKDAKEKLVEVQLYQGGESAWENESYDTALDQYHQFLEAYPESPFYPVSVDAVNTIPFEWAARSAGDHDYAAAVEILGRVDGSYATEAAALNAKRALQEVYLQWGQFFLEGGDFQQAIDPLQTAYLGDDAILGAQAEESIHTAYQSWASKSRAAEDYADAVKAYEAYADWLAEAELESPIVLDEVLAQVFQSWGSQLFAEADFEGSIEKFEEARAFDIPEITAQLDDRLASAYLEIGSQWLNSDSMDEAVGYFAAIILDHGASPAAAEIPAEAAAGLLLHAIALGESGEFSQALVIFEYLGALDLSADLAFEILAGWAEVLYQSERDMNYLESLRKLDQAARLAPQLEDAPDLTGIEELQAEVILAVSRLEVGLGQLILKAVWAVEVEQAEFPICDLVGEELVCLDETDYRLLMDAVGTDEETNLYVHGGGVPDDLTAKTPGEAQFIVRIINKAKWVQNCAYPATGMPHRVYFLTRQLRVFEVIVTDLQTGFKVGIETFIGGEPQGCPSARKFDPYIQRVDIFGPDPDPSRIYSWLLDFTR